MAYHEYNVIYMSPNSLNCQCAILHNLDLVACALQELDRNLLVNDICVAAASVTIRRMGSRIVKILTVFRKQDLVCPFAVRI
jgi:molybdopterin/thiamine biosynthesis adenylyltransferase